MDGTTPSAVTATSACHNSARPSSSPQPAEPAARIGDRVARQRQQTHATASAPPRLGLDQPREPEPRERRPAPVAPAAVGDRPRQPGRPPQPASHKRRGGKQRPEQRQPGAVKAALPAQRPRRKMAERRQRVERQRHQPSQASIAPPSRASTGTAPAVRGPAPAIPRRRSARRRSSGRPAPGPRAGPAPAAAPAPGAGARQLVPDIRRRRSSLPLQPVASRAADLARRSPRRRSRRSPRPGTPRPADPRPAAFGTPRERR